MIVIILRGDFGRRCGLKQIDHLSQLKVPGSRTVQRSIAPHPCGATSRQNVLRPLQLSVS
jgi:hypothetical protein